MAEGKRIKVGVAAGVVIERGGKYLLVQENAPDIRGLWNCPAGHVDEGLTIEETAVKEAKEESGFDVKLVRVIGIWHESAVKAVKHIFLAKIIGGDIKIKADEIMDVRWFTIDEIRAMKNKLRAPWVLEAIEMVEINENSLDNS